MATQKRDGSMVLVMVLLTEPAFPTAESFADRLARRLGGQDQVTWDPRTDKDGLVLQFFHVGDRRVDVALMPLPMPWKDLEGPCATNRMWPEATAVCKAHKAHLLVMVRGLPEDRPTSLRLLATQAVAALVEEVSAPAVYWGAGTIVHAGDQFIKMAAAASDEDLPLLLWVDFRIWRREDGSAYIATTGLADLGLMEFEGASKRLAPQELLEKVYNLSHYVCGRGPVLNDGDTFGASAAERISVHYRPSVWDRKEIIFLEFDVAGKKGLFARLFGR